MTQSKPDLKVGLIGTGFMGKAHAFGYVNAARVFDLPVTAVLHRVADIDLAAAEAAARAFGFAHASADWHDIVADPDVDIVSDHRAQRPAQGHGAGSHSRRASMSIAKSRWPRLPPKPKKWPAPPHQKRGVLTQVGFTISAIPCPGCALRAR
jgi:Predicted dehydrogenases and related proteins